MAIELNVEKKDGHEFIEIRASGTLSKEDYERFTPLLEKEIKDEGKIRILFEMKDFHGWDAGALWEDIKFDFRHFSDIERVAIVGDKKWEEWMATFCKPFTSAEIHYYDQSRIDEARNWIAGG